MDSWYLTIIVFLPALGALAVAALPQATPRQVKLTSTFFTLVPFALSLALFVLYDRAQGGIQFEQLASWIPAINSSYHLGVDGLSLPLVILTTFLGILVIFVSWKIELRAKEYFAWLLVLETGILGVFTSLDLVLFFLFWEVELIPMYMLISIWGTGRKEYSAIKFVIYTLIGSALMLAGILLLYFIREPHSMSMMDTTGTALLTLRGVTPMFTAIFFLLFIGFAIKLPMVPLHTWLPDAHTDAPTAVSVILAGILLKMGGYGLIRLCVTFMPDVAREYALPLIVLSVITVLYGAAVTLRQRDLKRLIAYSSISHMGYVLLGVFALSTLSLTGATLQMFSHGVVTGLLFAMVGLVYDKTHYRDLSVLGGLVRQMPVIAVVFSIAGLASLGLPGTSGFAAEFITFLGSFTSGQVGYIEVYTILAVGGIVVTAGYILWLLQRAFYGPPQERFNGVEDADKLEMGTIFSFVVVIMLIGIYPAVLTDVIKLGVGPILPW